MSLAGLDWQRGVGNTSHKYQVLLVRAGLWPLRLLVFSKSSLGQWKVPCTLATAGHVLESSITPHHIQLLQGPPGCCDNTAPTAPLSQVPQSAEMMKDVLLTLP